MMFADFLTDDLPLSAFNQSHVTYFRRKICFAVKNGALNYDIM